MYSPCQDLIDFICTHKYNSSMKDIELKKFKLINHLQKIGEIKRACKRVGVSRQTFYDWCSADEKFRKEAQMARDDFFNG